MDVGALPALTLTMAQARAVVPALHSLVAGLAACPRVALARVWLTGPGDRCGICHLAAECPDRSLCLHLVASAGNPTDPAVDCNRIDGALQRVPLGVRAVGRVGQTGAPLVVTDLPERGHGVADRAWLEQEHVRAFAAEPLICRSETLGVLALYDRDELGDDHLAGLRAFAGHAAVSLANARVFEQAELARRRLEDENANLRAELRDAAGPCELVGRSPAHRKLLQQVELTAATGAAVLIAGEVGAGKALLARAIHEAGPRRRHALIRIPCGAALPGEPLGRLPLADGGTVCLDEVGKAPPALQEQLLRLLQDGAYGPAGETRTRRVDVRVIATTTLDLRREVTEGRFREDLYCRLSVFPLDVPPLRERLDDVPLLAAHFARLAARLGPGPPPRLASAELERLRAYDWPGNVRELRAVVERAVLLAQGGVVTFGPLRAGRRRRPPLANDAAAPPSAAAAAPLTRDELRRLERQNIAAALARSGGKVFGPGGAAQLLGMKPTTLASRIRALNVEKPPRAAGTRRSA